MVLATIFFIYYFFQRLDVLYSAEVLDVAEVGVVRGQAAERD